MTEVTVTTNQNFGPNLVVSILNASFFGYFALGFDDDPDSCLAVLDSDTRWTSGAKDGVLDVGYSFRMVC